MISLAHYRYLEAIIVRRDILHLINVKDTKVAETNNSTWYNHVDRAHARMDEVGGDFIPQSHVLQEFSDVSDRSFRAELASISAHLINIESFGALIKKIEEDTTTHACLRVQMWSQG